jgi:hypothetical protein
MFSPEFQKSGRTNRLHDNTRSSMNRLLPIAVVLLGLLTVTLALRGGSSARADETAGVVVRVGDTVEVEGGAVGCKVVQQGDRAALDCRRAGQLAGSYGTLLDDRRARVVRFKSSKTAKVVFTAKHRGSARRCEQETNTRR